MGANKRRRRAHRKVLPPLPGDRPAPRTWNLLANYHLDLALGKWDAELVDEETLDDPDPPVLAWLGMFDTPRLVFDAVMAKLAASERDGLVISTAHVLDGDGAAWLKIAERDGFADLVERHLWD